MQNNGKAEKASCSCYDKNAILGGGSGPGTEVIVIVV